MKPLLAFLALWAVPAFAQDLGQCADELSDCHDNCSLKFGTSVKDTDRIKLAKCINVCQKNEQVCRDNYIETSVHQLDATAVKNANKHDDDFREDNRKKAIIEEDKPAQKTSSSEKKEKKEAQPAREEELPKRTATRAADLDPKPAPKAEAQAEPKPESKPEPVAEKQPEPKKEEPASPPPSKKKKDRALDEWDPEAL